MAFLEAMEYPFSLDHRSTATIWSRVEAQLWRDKYLVLNIDEAQHLSMGRKDKEIEVILTVSWTL